jgi:hypothetical protein
MPEWIEPINKEGAKPAKQFPVIPLRRVSADHASRTEPTLGTVIGTAISCQSFAFFFQQFINSLNEFNQPRWVLLHGCLLTQPYPLFCM